MAYLNNFDPLQEEGVEVILIDGDDDDLDQNLVEVEEDEVIVEDHIINTHHNFNQSACQQALIDAVLNSNRRGNKPTTSSGSNVIQVAGHMSSVSAERHLRLLPPNASVERGAGGNPSIIPSIPIHRIPFSELILDPLDNAFKIQGNLRPIRNYLIGMQKGSKNSHSAFSLYVGLPRNHSRTHKVSYFLKVDNNLLQKMFKTLVRPSISVVLDIKGMYANGTRRSGTLTSKSDLFFEAETKEAEVSQLLNGGGTDKMIILEPKPLGASVRALQPLWLRQGVTKLMLNRLRTIALQFSLSVFINFEGVPAAKEFFNLGSELILQNMFNLDDSSKDVTIIAANTSEIKCHKCILMAQSPSLYSMFFPQYEMAEAQTGRIQMNENSEDRIRQFIKLLYGFKAPVDTISADVALEVFELSNKYGVKQLEDFFKDFFTRKGMDWFTTDTIMELYFYVRNIESLEELKNHALTEMSSLSKDAIKSCDYFSKLAQGDATDLLFQLLEWK